MIVATKNEKEYYSCDSMTLELMNENTSFFSEKDRKSNSCHFIGTAQNLTQLGFKFKEVCQ